MVRHMNRSDPDDIRLRLQQAGLWSKKSLGQHFLVDEKSLETIVATARLNPQDRVVEIGPGLGVLSERLLESAGEVLAFELDQGMLKVLAQDFPQLHVVPGDILQTAHKALQGWSDYKVVSNIPYQITTPLLRLFLEGGVGRPVSLTLLVQKEVGKRLAARAGHSERGYLSVLCEYFSQTAYLADVPAASFFPPPRVDSGIVHLEVRRERLVAPDQEKAFLRFVHAAFTQKRKQLKNVLAGIRGVSTAQVQAQFAGLGLKETVRAQELDMLQWVSLFNAEPPS